MGITSKVFNMASSISLSLSSPQSDSLGSFFTFYPKELEPALDHMISHPMILNALKRAVVKPDGSSKRLTILFSNLHLAKATYIYEKNEIHLNSELKSELSHHVVPYLIFQINNAAAIEQSLIQKNSISDKDMFVRNTIQLEYESAKKTHLMVKNWIAVGSYPPNVPFAHLTSHFESYYLQQQLLGRAQSIAQKLEAFSPISILQRYRGTWPCPLLPSSKPILEKLIEFKMIIESDLDARRQQEAMESIKTILGKIETDARSLQATEEQKYLQENAHYLFRN